MKYFEVRVRILKSQINPWLIPFGWITTHGNVNLQLVSHPYSQLILNSEVYKGASFLEKSPWKQALVILLSSVLSPLMFMVWLVFEVCFPSHLVARMFHSPRVKFLIHCGSYQTFLFLLAITSPKSDFLRYSNTGKWKCFHLSLVKLYRKM